MPTSGQTLAASRQDGQKLFIRAVHGASVGGDMPDEVTLEEFDKWQMRANHEAQIRVRKMNAAISYAMIDQWDWMRQPLEKESNMEMELRLS